MELKLDQIGDRGELQWAALSAERDAALRADAERLRRASTTDDARWVAMRRRRGQNTAAPAATGVASLCQCREIDGA